MIDVARGARTHLATEAIETVWAPDGRCLAFGAGVAYVSTQSGRSEVYVAAWPALDRQRAVSTRGGLSPRWSRDSREVFYWQNQTLMAATVDTALNVGEPQPLFSGAFVGAAGTNTFDVASGGRFLMVKSDPRAELRQITVVQHWRSASAGSVK